MRFPAMCRWQSSCLWYQAECTCLVKRCSCLCCSNCRRFECLHILRNWSDSVKPWRDGCGNQCTSNTCKYFAFWPILAFCCLQSCVRHVSVATSNSRRLGLMQPWWACIGVPGQIPLPGICLFMFVWNRDSSGFYLAAISFVGHLPWCDGELFEKSHISCRAKAFKGPVASLQHVQNQNKARLSFAKEIDTCARMLLGFRVESSGFDVRAIWWGICSTLIRDPPYISSIVLSSLSSLSSSPFLLFFLWSLSNVLGLFVRFGIGKWFGVTQLVSDGVGWFVIFLLGLAYSNVLGLGFTVHFNSSDGVDFLDLSCTNEAWLM